MCRAENVFRQVLSKCVSRNLGGAVRPLQNLQRGKKYFHSHILTLFAFCSPFKMGTFEISRRCADHDDVILMAYDTCTCVLLLGNSGLLRHKQ